MKTKQLAEQIAGVACVGDPKTVEEIYRRLLLFLANDLMESYSPATRERREVCDFARDHNYFWLPCIICGTWVSGKEPHGTVMLTECEGVGCCSSPECLAEVERLNNLYPKGLQS